MPDFKKRPRYKLDMEVEIGDKIVSLNNKKSRLLQCIDKCGSIVKASKETGIPYRTALKNIEIMENELGAPIIATKRGGKGGGGSSELTDSGKEILQKFVKLNRVIKKHADLNELEGVISSLDEEERVMTCKLGQKKIVLPINEEFNIGDKVLILISPSDIFVTLEAQKSSVRNMLQGKITEMKFKNDIIRMAISINGIDVVADITELSRKELDLNLGKDVFIGFKAAALDIIKRN
ncbi:TOBE domain-containing protein [Methanobacterium sp. ACI-7]|uniref:TOBE domain-containing protein n=1 Tax=unclassified Methanobacterium TaxID=2627676 RepID=UPI0039C4BEAE